MDETICVILCRNDKARRNGLAKVLGERFKVFTIVNTPTDPQWFIWNSCESKWNDPNDPRLPDIPDKVEIIDFLFYHLGDGDPDFIPENTEIRIKFPFSESGASSVDYPPEKGFCAIDRPFKGEKCPITSRHLDELEALLSHVKLGKSIQCPSFCRKNRTNSSQGGHILTDKKNGHLFLCSDDNTYNQLIVQFEKKGLPYSSESIPPIMPDRFNGGFIMSAAMKQVCLCNRGVTIVGRRFSDFFEKGIQCERFKALVTFCDDIDSILIDQTQKKKRRKKESVCGSTCSILNATSTSGKNLFAYHVLDALCHDLKNARNNFYLSFDSERGKTYFYRSIDAYDELLECFMIEEDMKRIQILIIELQAVKKEIRSFFDKERNQARLTEMIHEKLSGLREFLCEMHLPRFE